MEVNTIELLVHPAFRQVHDAYATTLKPSEKHLLKNTFHAAGKIMLRVKANPQALMIFVPTFIQPKVEELFPFKAQQRKFIIKAREILGDRFLILKPEFGYPLSTSGGSFVENSASKKLGRHIFSENVEISATGEYCYNCVKTAVERLKKLLKEKGAKNTKILFRNDARTLVEAKEIVQQAKLNQLTKFSKWRRNVFGKRVPALPKRRRC